MEERSCDVALEQGALDFGQVVTCSTDPAGDVDTFAVAANGGEFLVIRLDSSGTRHCVNGFDEKTGREIIEKTCGSTIEETFFISTTSIFQLRVTKEVTNRVAEYSLSVDCIGVTCGATAMGDFPDVNGDGSGDIVVRQGNLFLGDTAKDGDPPDFMIRYGDPDDVVFFADMDGNGTDEVVVRRGNAFLIDLDNRGGAAELVIHFGAPDDDVLAYDLDNDGRDDLVVRRGNELLGDTAHNGGQAEKKIGLFGPVDVYLSRSSR